MTTLALGTANSSAAARRKATAKKSHSTSVKKNQTTRRSSQALSSVRKQSGSSRSAAHHIGAVRGSNAASRGAKGATKTRTVSVAKKQTSRMAATPRATQQEGQIKKKVTASIQRTTGSRATRQHGEERTLRMALARRAAWNDEGRRSMEPAKVQDPPADTIGQPEPARILAAKNGGQMVSATLPSGETYNEDLIRAALKRRGTPYVWGGASRGGWDCSGFVCYIFRSMRGMNLPHSASAQARMGTPVKKEGLLPGDLVFFSTYRPGVSHVGIYVGENKFIHAANSRRGTRMDTLTGYYGKRYKWARRLTPTPIQFSPQQLETISAEGSEIPTED